MAIEALPDLSLDAPPPRSGGGKKTLFLLVGTVVVTAGVTTVVVSSLTPSAGSAADAAAEDITETLDTVEAEIGTFNCSNNLPDASLIHVSFKLFATIADGQQTAFKEAVQVRLNARVRQAVSKVIRSSSLDDLDDPNHGVIKRQLKEEVNKVLRRSYINEIILVDFRILQQ